MPSACNLKPVQDYAGLSSAQTLSWQALIKGGGVRGTPSDWLGYAEQNQVARAWPSFQPLWLDLWFYLHFPLYLLPVWVSLEVGWGAEWGNSVGRKRDTEEKRDTGRNRDRWISSSHKSLRRQRNTTWILLQQALARFHLLAAWRWLTLGRLFPAPEEHRVFSEPFRLAMAAAFPFFLYFSSTWELELSPTSTSIVWTLSRTSLQCQPDAPD